MKHITKFAIILIFVLAFVMISSSASDKITIWKNDDKSGESDNQSKESKESDEEKDNKNSDSDENDSSEEEDDDSKDEDSDESKDDSKDSKEDSNESKDDSKESKESKKESKESKEASKEKTSKKIVLKKTDGKPKPKPKSKPKPKAKKPATKKAAKKTDKKGDSKKGDNALRGQKGEPGKKGEPGDGGGFPMQAALSSVLTDHFGPAKDKIVPFDLVLLDLGDNYDNGTGIFICTIPGVYVVSLYLMSHPGAKVNARIYINNRPIAALWADDNKNVGFYPSSSIQTVTRLEFGDQVYVMLVDGGYGESWVHANYNAFTIYLLYEDNFMQRR